MKRVYAIVGKKRSGKDTASDYLAEKLGCKKYALATPLKELVCNLFGITMEQLDQYKNEHWQLTAIGPDKMKISKGGIVGIPTHNALSTSFRSILQRCGDSQKGLFGLGVYMQKLQEKMMHERTAVISDVRLLEEQKWLMAHTDVTFIKITRDVKTDTDSAHRTEQEVDKLDFDVEIENNGSLDELYAELDNIIK